METIASKYSVAKGSVACVGVDGEDAVFDAGIADALESFGRAEPEVGGPDLHAEFAAQKDRRHPATATEVEHAHAGLEVERFGQPFGQPQRIGRATEARDHPLGMIGADRGNRSGINRVSVGMRTPDFLERGRPARCGARGFDFAQCELKRSGRDARAPVTESHHGGPQQVNGAAHWAVRADSARHGSGQCVLGRYAELSHQQLAGELAPAESCIVPQQVRFAHEQAEIDALLAEELNRPLNAETREATTARRRVRLDVADPADPHRPLVARRVANVNADVGNQRASASRTRTHHSGVDHSTCRPGQSAHSSGG